MLWVDGNLEYVESLLDSGYLEEEMYLVVVNLLEDIKCLKEGLNA